MPRKEADSKGLIWKVWIIDEASSLVGGIYLFEDIESLNNFVQGDIVKQVASHPAVSNLDAKIFDIIIGVSKDFQVKIIEQETDSYLKLF